MLSTNILCSLVEFIRADVLRAFQVLDSEALGVSFHVRFWIKRNAVHHCPRLAIGTTMGVTYLPHRFFVDAGLHDFVRDPFVVRDALDHAPPPQLRDPPFGVGDLRVIAIAN